MMAVRVKERSPIRDKDELIYKDDNLINLNNGSSDDDDDYDIGGTKTIEISFGDDDFFDDNDDGKLNTDEDEDDNSDTYYSDENGSFSESTITTSPTRKTTEIDIKSAFESNNSIIFDENNSNSNDEYSGGISGGISGNNRISKIKNDNNSLFFDEKEGINDDRKLTTNIGNRNNNNRIEAKRKKIDNKVDAILKDQNQQQQQQHNKYLFETKSTNIKYSGGDDRGINQLYPQHCSVCKQNIASSHKINKVLLACGHIYHLRCFDRIRKLESSSMCYICYGDKRFDRLVNTKIKSNDGIEFYGTMDADALLATVKTHSFGLTSKDIANRWKRMKEIGDSVTMVSQDSHFLVDKNDESLLSQRALNRSYIHKESSLAVINALKSSRSASELVEKGVSITEIQRSGCGIDLIIDKCDVSAYEFYNVLGFTRWSDLVNLGIKPLHLTLNRRNFGNNGKIERLFPPKDLRDLFGHNYVTIIDFIACCFKGESLSDENFNRSAIRFFCVELDYNTNDYIALGLNKLDNLMHFGRDALNSKIYIDMCCRLLGDNNYKNDMNEILGEVVGPFGSGKRQNSNAISDHVGISARCLFEEIKISSEELMQTLGWNKFDLEKLFNYSSSSSSNRYHSIKYNKESSSSRSSRGDIRNRNISSRNISRRSLHKRRSSTVGMRSDNKREYRRKSIDYSSSSNSNRNRQNRRRPDNLDYRRKSVHRRTNNSYDRSFDSGGDGDGDGGRVKSKKTNKKKIDKMIHEGNLAGAGMMIQSKLMNKKEPKRNKKKTTANVNTDIVKKIEPISKNIENLNKDQEEQKKQQDNERGINDLMGGENDFDFTII